MEPTDRPLITRLRAKNFRSIAEMDLELGPLTVLVGPNGAGKSNVVDVLRFFRDSVADGLERALLNRQGIDTIIRHFEQITTNEIYTSFDSNFATDTIYTKYGFSLHGAYSPDRLVFEEWLNIREGDTDLVDISYDDNNLKIHPPLIDQRGIEARINKSQSRGLRFPENILNITTRLGGSHGDDVLFWPHPLGSAAAARFYFFSASPLRLPQASTLASPLDEAGSNLAAVLREIRREQPSDAVTLDRSLEALVDGATGFRVENIGSHLVTFIRYVADHGYSIESDLGQESDGTIRMLAILAALYQTPPPPLIVIEEPEANIHPGALGVLAGVIKEASQRTQVIITTHSPDLIDHFDPDVIRVVERVDGATVVGKMEEPQRQVVKDKLFSTGEIMRIQGLIRETEE